LTDAIRGETDRLRWTSVPRWSPAELPAAASYLACGFGEAGEHKARALLAGADPGVPARTAVFAARWDAAAEAELRRLIAGCLAGVRIILAGPESLVMRAAAEARRLGAVSEELVLVATEAREPAGRAGPAPVAAEASGRAGLPDGGYVTGPAARRVFCAACRESFDADAALRAVVTCPGCGAGLIVDYRFSRPHAAYFGWPAGLDLHR
jgi:hypothetical protein